jgi:Amt family ammonium transporter
VAILVTIVYAFIVSYILLKIVDRLFGLRVDIRDERSGLDISQHEEAAYNI